MNCFDFDKTIYKYDCSIKFYLYCMARNFKCFLHFFKVLFLFAFHAIGLISTKKFKQSFFGFLKYLKDVDLYVEKFWEKQIKNINKFYNDIKREDDVICSASPLFLVKPVMEKINPSAKVFGTEMDKNTGVINGENLKGVAKVIKLKEEFGEDVKFENVFTDSFSDFPILDLTENKQIVCGKKYYLFGKQKPTFFVKVKYIIKQLRIKHYIKNVLIFLPLFFSGLLFTGNTILYTIAGFVSFCLMASFVYVVNDLVDAKNDRKHSTKRRRPIACYMIKPYEAIIMAIILFFGSLAINLLIFGLNWFIIAIVIGYAIINLLYSFVLKKMPIVDAFCLALCYLIRVLYGGMIIGIGVSKWLYLTILCASLFMGFGKRRNEIKNENDTRKVNKYYNYNFLDKNLYICLAMCLVFYSLWAIDFRPFEYDFNRLLLLITIPIVYFIMMRYSLDIEKSSNSGDPIDVLLKDFVLILSVAFFVALIIIAVYVPVNLNIFI